MRDSFRIVAAVVSVAFALPSVAEEDWHSWPVAKRFIIAPAVFLADLETTVVVTDAAGNTGTPISVE